MKKYMIALAMMLLMSSAAHAYVYSDYTWYTYNGHQYAATFVVGPWEEVQAEAYANGWNLVTINEEAENNWLTAQFDGILPSHHCIWIGLRRVDGEWAWVSGEPVSYDPPWCTWCYNYGTGSHAYLHTASHSVSLGTWNNNYWHDTRADHYLRGIIEIPEPACPVAYWSFDNDGDPGHDDSGNGHNGTVYGGVTSIFGMCGKALDFDGVNGYINFGNTVGNFGTDDFSVVFWMRTNTSRGETVIGKRVFCGVHSFFEVTMSEDGTPPGSMLVELYQSYSNKNLIVSNQTLDDNQWHLIAITRDGVEARLYIDGDPDSSNSTVDITPINNGASLLLGNGPCRSVANISFFSGELDEVRIYDRALSACEIKILAHNPLQPQLLFRELGTTPWGTIPFTYDHVGFYPGAGQLVWESHKGYPAGYYWDPETNSQVYVEKHEWCVQQEHTRGSFLYDALVGEESPVEECDAVSIDPVLAQEMAALIQSQDGAGYVNWYEWVPIVRNRFIEPWLQKGGLGTFTCVGLVEWAAEEYGHHDGQGFVPNIIELVFYLTPSVQRWCILGKESIWDSAKKKLVGWFDPVDFILTDPLGRRLGFANGQNYTEIPDAFYTGDGDFEMLGIAYKLPGDYTIEFFGVGQDYNSVISVIDSNGLVREWSFSGHLDTGESVLEILPENRPPVAICRDVTVEADSNCECIVTAKDVNDGSYDPDGDVITLSLEPAGPYPLGQTVVTLTVSDGIKSATCEATVTVVDTTPPEFSLSVDPNVLWPPNHKMVQITPTITASDNCDDSPTVTLISITINEGEETNTFDPAFDNTLGDGHTSDDIQIIDGNIYLRAERSGKGDGREYNITYRATDVCGNYTERSVAVVVPHNQP